MVPRTPSTPAPSAVELLESALALLRRMPGSRLAVGWAAVTPLAVGLAWAVADLSHHPRAAQRVLPWATLLTLLLAWSAVGQAWFGVEVRRALGRVPGEPWCASRLLDLALPQVALQGCSLLTLPLALLLALPFPVVFAWHQAVAVAGDLGGGSVRRTAARAWSHCRSDWMSLAALTGLIMACGALLALNLAVTLVAVPFLLRTLLAIDTHVALSPALALNSTFLSVVIATTWILMDPVIKAAFAVRLFHGESRSTGADLLPVFAPRSVSTLARSFPLLPLALALGLLTASAPQARAAAAESPRTLRAEAPVASAESLRQSVDAVLARPEFAWRIAPPVEDLSDGEGPDWLERLRESVLALLRRLRDAVGDFLDWLEKQFQPSAPLTGGTPAWLDWLHSPQAILSLALVALALLAAWLVWSRVRLRGAVQVTAVAVAATPDLNAEELLATDLPAEDWRSLADDLLRRGETRLAIRALYLATLSDLATRGLLLVARFKSNADYLGELKRKPRATPPLIEAFARLMGSFERVWYGTHPATPELFQVAAEDARRLRP